MADGQLNINKQKAPRNTKNPDFLDSPPKRPQAGTRVNMRDSTSTLVGSGDAQGSSFRPQAVTAYASRPGGGQAPSWTPKPKPSWTPKPEPSWTPKPKTNWTPKPKAADTAEIRKNSPNPHPTVDAGDKRAAPGEARAPSKIPPRRDQPVPSPPEPEDVPLGTDVKMGKQTVKEVERQTRGQRQNPKWFSWRRNRITASIAHQVSHSRFVNGRSSTPPASYLGSITGERRGIVTRAMAWGNDNEAKVAQEYQELKSQLLGRPVQVQDCGLFIHPECAWLAASPDGIVVDPSSGERLCCLEIKCPYKHRNTTVAEACRQDRQFCLELLRNAGEGEPQYRLKTTHNYYTQVQCQMAVVGLHKADFVVFTLHEIAIVPVTFDPAFWESTQAKMEKFYKEALLPYLKKKGQGVPHQQRREE
ncbi:hypothetical protein AGOR_G00127950 [Albula goreensis]|uniref:YqaJ viral recombinase domain-containing protein n=1 Tax=Albula goreensis TaxID=1534307 RepID=A0A8T3DDJ0_9TELE|nr:hypothetical protein AGOR_G00127950 [Albula goreensis]